MIMVLSDGGSAPGRIQHQLDLRREDYIVYFTNFKAAGKFGKGSVIIGDGSALSIGDAVKKNRISGVIDALVGGNEISENAMAVCGDTLPYVKYLNMEVDYNARVYLSYIKLAEEVKRRGKNVVMFASPRTVKAMVSAMGGMGENIYVAIPKGVVFDTEEALKYNVPIRNIKEADMHDPVPALKSLTENNDICAIVCDLTVGVSGVKTGAEALGKPLFILQGTGAEYKNPAATAADAVMTIRNLKDEI